MIDITRTLKMYINEVDNLIIIAGLLLPLVVFGIHAYHKRGKFNLSSLLVLIAAESVALAVLAGPFVREVLHIHGP